MACAVTREVPKRPNGSCRLACSLLHLSFLHLFQLCRRPPVPCVSWVLCHATHLCSHPRRTVLCLAPTA